MPSQQRNRSTSEIPGQGRHTLPDQDRQIWARKRHLRRSKIVSLFDHFVGDGEHAGRNVEPESLCGLEINDQLKFGGL